MVVIFQDYPQQKSFQPDVHAGVETGRLLTSSLHLFNHQLVSQPFPESSLTHWFQLIAKVNNLTIDAPTFSMAKKIIIGQRFMLHCTLSRINGIIKVKEGCKNHIFPFTRDIGSQNRPVFSNRANICQLLRFQFINKVEISKEITVLPFSSPHQEVYCSHRKDLLVVFLHVLPC